MIDRRRAVQTILQDRPDDLLVVSGLGSPTYDVAAAQDNAKNFYLWGAMGGAASMGLGLAQARPDARVLVVTGDGEMLMGMGSLATIGGKQAANLAVLVIDNEAFGETGGQTSHTGLNTDMTKVADACGFKHTMTVANEDDLPELREMLVDGPGPVLGVIKVASDEMVRVLPERDGHAIRTRFRSAVS